MVQRCWGRSRGELRPGVGARNGEGEDGKKKLHQDSNHK